MNVSQSSYPHYKVDDLANELKDAASRGSPHKQSDAVLTKFLAFLAMTHARIRDIRFRC
jgi:hypothetical protein